MHFSYFNTLQTDCSTLQSREEFIFSAFKIDYCCHFNNVQTACIKHSLKNVFREAKTEPQTLCGIIPLNFSLINRVAEFNHCLVILAPEHKL